MEVKILSTQGRGRAVWGNKLLRRSGQISQVWPPLLFHLDRQICLGCWGRCVPEDALSIRHRDSSAWQNRLLCHKKVSIVSWCLYCFKWVFGIVLLPEFTQLMFTAAFCCKLAEQDAVVLHKTSWWAEAHDCDGPTLSRCSTSPSLEMSKPSLPWECTKDVVVAGKPRVGIWSDTCSFQLNWASLESRSSS